MQDNPLLQPLWNLSESTNTEHFSYLSKSSSSSIKKSVKECISTLICFFQTVLPETSFRNRPDTSHDNRLCLFHSRLVLLPAWSKPFSYASPIVIGSASICFVPMYFFISLLFIWVFNFGGHKISYDIHKEVGCILLHYVIRVLNFSKNSDNFFEHLVILSK